MSTLKEEAQKIFETVAQHLLRQNKRSQSPDGHCRYRQKEHRKELKCAVGVLIDDKDYTTDMENKSVSHLIDDYKDRPSIVRLRQHVPLLTQLQELHDLLPALEWHKHLKAVAIANRLSTKACQTK